jgi:hypothetical protein
MRAILYAIFEQYVCSLTSACRRDLSSIRTAPQDRAAGLDGEILKSEHLVHGCGL